MSRKSNRKRKAVAAKTKTATTDPLPTTSTTEINGESQAAQSSIQEQTSGQVAASSAHVLWVQNWVPIIISALTLCVVISHAILYHKQWQAMNDQISLMSEGLEQDRAAHLDDNRAYLSLKAIKLDKPLNTFEETQKVLHLSVHFENTGRTPALNVSKTVAIRAYPIGSEPGIDYYVKEYKESAEDFKKEGVIDSRAVVPPGMDYADDYVITFDPDEINNLRSAKNAMYYQALIEYDDIFGRHWTSEVCLLSQSYYRDDFQFCSEHNTFK